MAEAEAQLPTYKTAARVLEQEKGSGLKLAGWTVLRTIIIAPPMMVVGVPAKQAWAGAAISSGLISIFTLLRLFDTRTTGLAGLTNPAAKAARARARRGHQHHRSNPARR